MKGKEFKQTSGSESETELALRKYTAAMEVYQRITKKVRALERRYPQGVRDSEINAEIAVMDKERHQDHLELIKIAKSLSKSKEDVLIDIIRWENSLEEYGLPEFSILKSSDIVDTHGFHSAIAFNIDLRHGKPGAAKPLDEPFENYVFGGKPYRGATRVIPEDKILLVFSINPIAHEFAETYPRDYQERVTRAEALAKEIGGEYFDHYDGAYHTTNTRIIGVVFPKKDLEKVLGIIRKNPGKFRIGKEFYKTN